MFQITDQERIEVSKRVAYILSRCSDKASAVDILSEAYCEFLSDKTEMQGDMMATEILRLMSVYQDHYRAACSDPESYVESQLAELLREEPLEEQCNSLYLMIRCLEPFCKETVWEKLDEATRENYLQLFADAMKPGSYRGDISAEARDQLLQQAINTVKAVASVVSEYEAGRTEVLADKVRARYDSLRPAKIDEDLLTAIAAMVIYTMLLNGEMENVPENFTLEEVVVFACQDAAVEDVRMSYMQKVITREQCKNCFSSLWAVAAVLLFAAYLAAGAAVIIVSTHMIFDVLVIVGECLFAGMLSGALRNAALNMLDQTAEDISDVHLTLAEPDVSAWEVLSAWRKEKKAAASVENGNHAFSTEEYNIELLPEPDSEFFDTEADEQW